MIDPDIVGALDGIVDPELAIGIVDLGLVYRAEHTAAGIEVVMTMTSPSCPVSELLVEQVRDALRGRFPDSAHQVTLTFTPAWSPERISPAGQERLGWRKRALESWPSKSSRRSAQRPLFTENCAGGKPHRTAGETQASGGAPTS